MITGIKTEVISLPRYELPFRQGRNGWWGSDCAFSLPLDKNRVLWLFGDTFVQHDRKKRSRAGAEIINNSIAIQQGALTDSFQPLTFFWSRNAKSAESFFKNDAHPGFLWPLSAVLISGKLFVFTLRMIHPQPEIISGFHQIGCEIFCIENPQDSPEKWKMHVYELPWKPDLGSFGSYVLVDNDYLYIYGFRKDKKNWFDYLKLIIARVNLEQTQDIYNIVYWEFLNGHDRQWSSDIEHMKPALDNSTTEFSVTYLTKLKKYVMVANSAKSGEKITIRFSNTPYGPFGEPQIVYHCPETKWNHHYFCYAAKAHPELAKGDDELVITYMTNSKILQDCFADLRIYYPRFLKIKINL